MASLAAIETMWCLFLNGPTEDGGLPSKIGRDELQEEGAVDRAYGYNWLTSHGTRQALLHGFGAQKDVHRRPATGKRHASEFHMVVHHIPHGELVRKPDGDEA